MSTDSISLADAKAQLSELTARAARGETLLITKRGKPVARLTRPDVPRKPVPLARLQALTASMAVQQKSAGDFTRGQPRRRVSAADCSRRATACK